MPVIFRWALREAYSASQTSSLNLRGEGKKSGVGNMGGAITGDGKGAEEEKEGNRHPPHVRSPPTCQLWRCWLGRYFATWRWRECRRSRDAGHIGPARSSRSAARAVCCSTTLERQRVARVRLQQGCSGPGRGGRRPPNFFDRGDASPTPPTFLD